MLNESKVETSLAVEASSGMGLVQAESFAGLKLNVDLRPAVAFTPVADPDRKDWGPWEFWIDCKGGELPNGTLGIMPTGHFLCWNRETGERWTFVDAKKAEMFCVLWNGPGPEAKGPCPNCGVVDSLNLACGEVVCAECHEGRPAVPPPTRMMDPFKGSVASSLVYGDFAPAVLEEMARMMPAVEAALTTVVDSAAPKSPVDS